MVDWFGISEKKQHEKIIQNIKKKLILQREEDCKDDRHSITITSKRNFCKMLGCHVLVEQKTGMRHHFIHKIMCKRWDYVKWTSQEYRNYEDYIHTDCLEK